MGHIASYANYLVTFVFVFTLLNSCDFLVQVILCLPTLMITLFIVKEINDSLRATRLLPSITDKAVVITGCDTGFGYLLAQRLDLLGVTVYAGCLDPEGKGAKELRKICSKNLHIVYMDVTKEDIVRAAVKEVGASLGDKKLWAIVNNAGIATFGDLEFCSLNKIQEIMDVNVLGILRVTQAFLPFVRKTRGRVIIVASLAGRITMNGFTPYSMSKHAAVALADGLRREMMKFGVTVHCIEPYFYRTHICEYDVHLRSLKENWDQSPEDVRRDYGDEFYKNCEVFINDLQKEIIPVSRLHEVIDDMLDASLGTDPKMYYEIGGGLQRKLYYFLPTKIVDYCFYFLTPRGVP